MTARATSASAHSDAWSGDAWSGIRRQLALHRRTVSAALAFVAVLVALTALAQTPQQQSSSNGSGAAPPSVALLDDHLTVPLRLSDPAVATLLAPGDVVDVIVADQRSAARLVAADLTVTAIPNAEASGPWTDSDGLVMVAATEDEALALAGATASGPITVAVHP